MSSQVVDLCGIAPDNYKNFPPRAEETDLDNYLDDQYSKDSAIIEKEFEAWLEHINRGLIQDVHNFITDSCHTKKGLFKVSDELIHPATLILGMQTSDHAATIDLVVRQTRKKFPNIQLLRLKPDLRKKASLFEVIDLVDRDKVIVIVEKADNLELLLLESLIRNLHRILADQTAKKIMILFCVSSTFKLLSTYICRDLIILMKNMKYIKRDSQASIEEVRQRLIECRVSPIRLGPDVIDMFLTEFIERDASITNLRYMFGYMLFDKLHRKESALLLPKEKLNKLLQSDSCLKSFILELNSIQKHKNDLCKKSSSELVNFCWEKVQELREYHDLAVVQLEYFFTLIRDTTFAGFPSESTDLYEELLIHDNLSHSNDFVDAINKLITYPVDRIVNRIEKCLTVYKGIPEDIKSDGRRSVPMYMKDLQELYPILKQFHVRLENNDDSKEVVREFISRLLKYAPLLENPLKKPLSEALYVVDSDHIRKATSPSTRFDIMRCMMRRNTYLDILYRIVASSPESMSMSDLFMDFQQEIELIDMPKQKENIIEQPPMKSRKSSARLSRKVNPPSVSNTNGGRKKPEKMPEGFLEALFLDSLDSLERLGIIKRDTRRSRKGMILKCMWL